MLEIKDLFVFYGVIPALNGISINVNKSEIVTLIGANGAGKTTTMHTISGLIRAKSGTIKFKNQNITEIPAHEITRMGISQVPEGRGIFPNLSVVENLHLGAYLRKDNVEIERDEKWIYELFPRLKERRNQMAATLSGGELQMLAIARSLMSRPEMLLLDEPSMGLAPILVEDIFKTIQKLNHENGTTILLVEQNAQIALSVSHRAYVLETGKIVIEGISKELIKNDDVRKTYLGI